MCSLMRKVLKIEWFRHLMVQKKKKMFIERLTDYKFIVNVPFVCMLYYVCPILYFVHFSIKTMMS